MSSDSVRNEIRDRQVRNTESRRPISDNAREMAGSVLRIIISRSDIRKHRPKVVQLLDLEDLLLSASEVHQIQSAVYFA